MQGRGLPVEGFAGARSLKKTGGAGAPSAKQEAQLLKNKNKIKAEADLPEVAEPIATIRRRESAAHLGARASNKDVCVRARKRVRAQKG